MERYKRIFKEHSKEFLKLLFLLKKMENEF